VEKVLAWMKVSRFVGKLTEHDRSTGSAFEKGWKLNIRLFLAPRARSGDEPLLRVQTKRRIIGARERRRRRFFSTPACLPIRRRAAALERVRFSPSRLLTSGGAKY
jgi:hypothetical protein